MTAAPAADPLASLSPPTGAALRDAILETLDAMKGENTVTIDLTGKSDVASYMIISSGGSTTKVGALADEVRKMLKACGAEVLNVDGTSNRDWVLIDANDCVVHLFRPPVREFYNLEKLWAPETAIPQVRDGVHPLEVSSEPDLIDAPDSDFQ